MKTTFLFPVINPNQGTINTIESVLNQTDQDFILKVSVNNGYNKNDKDILKKYINHPKIKINFNKKNYGQIKNFKKLFNNTDTEFFSLISQDDILKKNFLEELKKKLLENRNSIFAFCDYSLIDNDNEELGSGVSTEFEEDENTINYYQIKNFLKYFNSVGSRMYGLYRSEIKNYIKIENIVYWDRIFLLKIFTLGKVKYIKKILRSRNPFNSLNTKYEIHINREHDNDDLKNFLKNFNLKKRISELNSKWVIEIPKLRFLKIVSKFLQKNIAIKDIEIIIKNKNNLTFERQLENNFYKKIPFKVLMFYFNNIKLIYFFWKNKSKIVNSSKQFLVLLYIFLKKKNYINFYRIIFPLSINELIIFFQKKYKNRQRHKLKNFSKKIVHITNNSFTGQKEIDKRNGASKYSLLLLSELKKYLNIYNIIPPRNDTKAMKMIEKLNISNSIIFYNKMFNIKSLTSLKKKNFIISIHHNPEAKHLLQKKINDKKLKFIRLLLKKRKFGFYLNNFNKINIALDIIIFLKLTFTSRFIYNVIKNFYNEFIFYKNSNLIFQTFHHSTIFSKIFNYKTGYLPYFSFSQDKMIVDNIYKKRIICIGSGNKPKKNTLAMGDNQILNFLFFLGEKKKFLKNFNEIIITGKPSKTVLKKDILPFKKINLNLDVVDTDDLNKFLNQSINLIIFISSDKSGPKTKIIDLIDHENNYFVFLNEKNISKELPGYDNNYIKQRLINKTLLLNNKKDNLFIKKFILNKSELINVKSNYNLYLKNIFDNEIKLLINNII